MKCISDKMREKTNLGDYYGQEQNLPPLLICNQNKSERVQQSLLETSVLLKGELGDCYKLNKNQSNEIYQRNVPNRPLPVNVDMRPINSSKCSDPRFLREREELENYNQYQVSLNCQEEAFMPGKGTVNRFFNNIDVDSELKNINEIDTKCSEKLFKVDPRDNKTKLSCYSDTLVKDYKKCDDQHGSTWCDYQKCGKLETFDKCDSKTFKCVNPKSDLSMYDNMPNSGRLLNGSVLSADLMNQIKLKQERQNTQQTTLLQQEQNRIKQIEADLKLLDTKRDLTLENNLNRHRMQFAPIQKPEDILQFKPSGDLNVYAPIIRRQQVNEDEAFKQGRQRSMEIQLDTRINERVNQLEQELGKQTRGYNPNPSNNCVLEPVTETELYPFQCRDQTRNLYKFNKLVGDSKDCLFCEQLFNNQTKRKHISVGRVPEHIYQDQ